MLANNTLGVLPMSGAGAALAGSPLFLTDLDAPFMWSEIQFVLSGPINGLVERMFETEARLYSHCTLKDFSQVLSSTLEME